MTTVDKFEFEDVRFFRYGYSPFGRPSLFVYIYFVDGLLIDSGQIRAQKTILNSLSELDVKQLFITHHHEDHSGNIPALKEQFDCPVFAPELCCELMKNPPGLSFAQHAVWGDRPAYHDLKPVSNALTTDNYTFQIIPIPGHADDMAALYEPTQKWLFSADLYINSYIGYFMKEESIEKQIQSIKKILDLDFEVMFCSHNPRLKDGREKLEKKLSYLQGFYQTVISWYQKGYSPKEIYKAMKLNEHGYIHLLSHGQLSKMNMVKSAVRDFDKKVKTSI